MGKVFFEMQSAAVLDGFARTMLVGRDAFSTDAITCVERAAEHIWPYTALAISTPSGSVVSVAPGLLQLAETNRPRHHYEATETEFLSHFAAHARVAGADVEISGQSIGWALFSIPAKPELPAGLRFERKTKYWMNAEQVNRRFENSVGEPGLEARDIRNKYAVAVVDETGSPIAVAGVMDTFGLDELGADVLSPWRGKGLGAAVISAAVHEILARGGTPLYACAAANIRSQRMARGTGFVPVFADASVS